MIVKLMLFVMNVSVSTMSDKYETDSWIRAIFREDIWFDPCPIDWNKDLHACGLAMDWRTPTFVNPPYSNPLPWVAKAIEVNRLDGHTVVLLLKHDSSTEWYRMLHEAGARFLLVNKRLKHCTKSGAAFPSVLAVLE